MKNKLHLIVRLSLIAAFTLTAFLRAEDKPAKREFPDAAKELIGKVRGLIAEDRGMAFQEYAKGAQELAKEFPSDSRPLMMLAEASTLVEDKKLSKTLAEKAEKGILAILKKDPKDSGANAALMRMADSVEPEKAKDFLKRVMENGPAQMASAAAGKLKKMDALGKPVKMAFKAVDGRQVDLGKLKGKVVLIDFWATWCGPCVAELPNVKKTYAKYHEKGFEIVGISLDQSKDKLTDFVKENEMPWPQHFDGLGWKNEFAVMYGIQGIPAMWLVNKEGNLVDMKARSELDSKVEKLLAE